MIKIIPHSIAQVLEVLIFTQVIAHLESDEPSQNTYTLFLYVPYEFECCQTVVLVMTVAIHFFFCENCVSFLGYCRCSKLQIP